MSPLQFDPVAKETAASVEERESAYIAALERELAHYEQFNEKDRAAAVRREITRAKKEGSGEVVVAAAPVGPVVAEAESVHHPADVHEVPIAEAYVEGLGRKVAALREADFSHIENDRERRSAAAANREELKAAEAELKRAKADLETAREQRPTPEPPKSEEDRMAMQPRPETTAVEPQAERAVKPPPQKRTTRTAKTTAKRSSSKRSSAKRKG